MNQRQQFVALMWLFWILTAISVIASMFIGR